MISRLNSNGFISIEIRIQTTCITSACTCNFRRTCGRSDGANVLGNAVSVRSTNFAAGAGCMGLFLLISPVFPALLPLSSEATFHPKLVETYGF